MQSRQRRLYASDAVATENLIGNARVPGALAQAHIRQEVGLGQFHSTVAGILLLSKLKPPVNVHGGAILGIQVTPSGSR